MTNNSLGEKLNIIRGYTVKSGELLHRARQISNANPSMKDSIDKYVAGVKGRNMEFVAMFYGNGREITIADTQLRADEYIKLSEEELERLKA